MKARSGLILLFVRCFHHPKMYCANSVLNGVMLDKAGIIEDSPDSTTMNEKTVDEATGQSPTKKGSFTDVLDQMSELEYTMVKVGDWRERRYDLSLVLRFGEK
ncbi:hypothetical protein EV702DRAFT_1050719 [Suillus placidus]|uniref:Uncharacterized protein n=1 Tax=Suillus placidus TaxID=48579 RepID=A0A9P6ZHG8_9AGAM|nr:hypothetical protein EV702DRAFT_1050719 [Suillus placidus]